MIYVFDLGPFRILFNNYYRSRFPTLWDNFDNMIVDGTVVSVREVYKEIQAKNDMLLLWAKNNKDVFKPPTEEEIEYVKDIFKINHFQSIIRKQSILKGSPVADPFVIAKARSINGCVVTVEHNKENSSRIPNICKEFNIGCLDLEGFMEKEGWRF